MHKHKTLLEIHEDVPANHYDQGIKKNIFQKYWHWRRFTEVLKEVEPTSEPILDLGCHSGTFTERVLSKIGTKQVYGIDVSPSAISLAAKRIPYGKFVIGDATSLPYENNFFNEVFCLEMLEHVDDPIAVLKESKRVLKKGGKMLILVPSDNNFFKLVWFIWTLYYHHWRHAHVQSYRNDLLEKVIKEVGFKVLKVKTFNSGMLKLIVCQKI